jgi:FAD synthetase
MALQPRGVAFGVFDRLHAGHHDFLQQASAACGHLTVLVAPDAMVLRFKRRRPWQTEEERVGELARRGYDARLGDQEPGAYAALRELRPEVILLGYDQQSLARDIERRIAAGELPRAELRVMASRDPTVHTSTLYPRPPSAAAL